MFGYIVGILLAVAVGSIGSLVFGEVSGMKYIAIGAAVVFAVAVPVADARRASR
jgi:predicted outer membrane lipoprotein